MWPPWGRKSPTRIQAKATPAKKLGCPTLKDLQHLCKEEDKEEEADQQIPKKPSVVHRRLQISTLVLPNWSSRPIKPVPDPPPETNAPPPDTTISLAGAEKRIVVYFTSLRVVRKTFEDCRTVRTILRGFRVSIDERDLTMDAGFLEELKGVLGLKKLSVPRVFIGGRYIGGADEIKQLHEIGQLKKLVQGFPVAESGVCDACGGYRFLLCDHCNGSHKCYSENGGCRSCTDCNENGLIRCSYCFSSLRFSSIKSEI